MYVCMYVCMYVNSGLMALQIGTSMSSNFHLLAYTSMKG